VLKIVAATPTVNPSTDLVCCFDVSKHSLPLYTEYDAGPSVCRVEDTIPSQTNRDAFGRQAGGDAASGFARAAEHENATVEGSMGVLCYSYLLAPCLLNENKQRIPRAARGNLYRLRQSFDPARQSYDGGSKL
jgi:hypothetical protein